MAEQDTSARLRHEACHIETDETLEHVAKLMREGADELDALRARLEAAERQDPVLTVESFTNGSYSRNYKTTWHRDVQEGSKLYARPIPAPADGVPDVALAIKEVTSAIYFNDSSDYLPALWCVLHALSPELYTLAERSPRAAWERADQLSAPQPGEQREGV